MIAWLFNNEKYNTGIMLVERLLRECFPSLNQDVPEVLKSTELRKFQCGVEKCEKTLTILQKTFE